MTKNQQIELISRRIEILQILRTSEYAFMKETMRDRWESSSEKFNDMLKAEVSKLEEALALPEDEIVKPDTSVEEHG